MLKQMVLPREVLVLFVASDQDHASVAEIAGLLHADAVFDQLCVRKAGLRILLGSRRMLKYDERCGAWIESAKSQIGKGAADT